MRFELPLGIAVGGSIIEWSGIASLGIDAGVCGVVTAMHLVLSERWSLQEGV